MDTGKSAPNAAYFSKNKLYIIRIYNTNFKNETINQVIT